MVDYTRWVIAEWFESQGKGPPPKLHTNYTLYTLSRKKIVIGHLEMILGHDFL